MQDKEHNSNSPPNDSAEQTVPPTSGGEAVPSKPVLIEMHTPCRGCGYDLIGTTSENSCPECGMSVFLTIKGDRLEHANPKWVAQMHTGSDMITYSLACLLLTGCVSFSCAAMEDQLMLVPFICLASVYGFLAVGFWHLTMPEPNEIDANFSKWRSRARCFFIIPLCTHYFALLLGFLGNKQADLFLLAFRTLCWLFFLYGVHAMGRHMSRLGKRLMSIPLENQSMFLAWLLPISGLMTYGFLVGVGRLGQLVDMPVLIAVSMVSSLGTLGLFVGMIWSGVLSFIFRKKLEITAMDAREFWAKDKWRLPNRNEAQTSGQQTTK